jgi:hypothetical protein
LFFTRYLCEQILLLNSRSSIFHFFSKIILAGLMISLVFASGIGFALFNESKSAKEYSLIEKKSMEEDEESEGKNLEDKADPIDNIDDCITAETLFIPFLKAKKTTFGTFSSIGSSGERPPLLIPPPNC